MTSKKKRLHFHFGAIFVKSKHKSTWSDVAKVFTHFAQISKNFARIYSDFSRIFTKSKVLGAGLHPRHPASYTSVANVELHHIVGTFWYDFRLMVIDRIVRPDRWLLTKQSKQNVLPLETYMSLSLLKSIEIHCPWSRLVSWDLLLRFV